MFKRLFLKLEFDEVAVEWMRFLNEKNVLKKSKRYILKCEKKANNKEHWTYYKYWVFNRFVLQNFEISEKFIQNFKKLVSKLDITLNIREEKFLWNIEELYFTSWRPLKDFPVKFQLDRRESINFMILESNIHIYTPEEDKKIKFLDKGQMFFSSSRMFVCDSNQIPKKIFYFQDIEKIELLTIGVVVTISGTRYLFRSENRYLIYVILQRLVPSMEININKVPNLYSYFNYIDKLLEKITF